jgi:hypothetical protein
MWPFIALTAVLVVGLSCAGALMRHSEIMANWSKYRTDPFYMFAAPMFKPDDDPRSRLEFGADNFKDTILIMLNNIFATLLQPVFQVFKLFMDAMSQSLNGLFNIKALLSNMWNKWNKMTDVFTRRFHAVFHEFRKTFTGIFNAMEKSYGVAVSSLFAGISTIHTMTSFFDLVIKIIITILVILVIMIILLFFVLWPFIPIIGAVIAIIAATALGGAVGGMSDSFCFTPDTKVQTVDGPVRIDELKMGTFLSPKNQVVAVMKFIEAPYDLYSLDGIHVSGSHIVYMDTKPIFVKDHPDAKPIGPTPTILYCLVTSTHTIPLIGISKTHIFADWEEIEEEEDLSDWYKDVYKTLNLSQPQRNISSSVMNTEAALAKGTLIKTVHGLLCVEALVPGDDVYSDSGIITKVLGIVKIHPSQVRSVAIYGNTCISSGCWVFEHGVWDHPVKEYVPLHTSWYQLFTEDGAFQIQTSAGTLQVRDYSDVGCKEIHKTYAGVLQRLGV